jgi:hypothetical protein
VVTDAMTYRQVDILLTELGFSRQHMEPKWLRYEHAATDTIIVLVEKKSNQRVRASDAESLRRHLIEKGLVGEEEMQALLAKT